METSAPPDPTPPPDSRAALTALAQEIDVLLASPIPEEPAAAPTDIPRPPSVAPSAPTP